MKVYIVTKEVRCDGESDFNIEIFGNKAEANDYFVQATFVYKQDANLDEWVIDEDSSTCFAAYEEGYECENHYYFNIYEKEI